MQKSHKCPKCGKGKAIEHNKYGILPCKSCQKKDEMVVVKRSPEFYTATQTDRIVHQRDQFAKDILQPFEGKNHKPNVEFAKAYPERAKDYFNEGDLNKL